MLSFRRLLLLGLCLSLCSIRAEGDVLPAEIVHSVPVETELATPDLREPVSVWCECFDKAERSIDVAQFYVSGKEGSRLDTVIAHLRTAGERGVRIRFLMDSHGVRMSDDRTMEELKSIPNLSFRLIDYGKVGGGIVHAKYFVVDGSTGYLGSQNFDWRSLEHIHETGVLIHDPEVAKGMQAIFDCDWQAQELIQQNLPVPGLMHGEFVADGTRPLYLVASPKAFNPVGVGDSEAELPRLLSQARHEVWVCLMTYAPLSYGKGVRPYYAVIDNALRTAEQRGVQVNLMVSDWNTKEPELSYLKSLEVLPNITVKIVSLPQAKSGFIPYARVVHSKIMTIDGETAWVGTSNWEGGYLDNSRNLEFVIKDTVFAGRVRDLVRQLWESPYAAPLDVGKVYPRPHPGSE